MQLPMRLPIQLPTRHTTLLTLSQYLHFFVLFLICFSSNAESLHKGFSFGEKPDWVKPTSVQQNERELNQPTQYFLIDRQINVTSGKQIYSRNVSKPLTADGLTQASEISITFNSEYEQLIVHGINVKRGSETFDLERKAKLRFLNQEKDADQLIHTGLITATFNLPDIRVGDVIDVSYSRLGTNPVFGKKPFGSQALNWGVSVDQLHVRLLSGSKLTTKVFNSDKNIRKIKRPSHIEHIYEEKNTSAITDEKRTVDGESLHAWLQYSAYQSWSEVNDWAVKLYDQVPTTRETKTLSDELMSQSKNKHEYVVNAIEFVQEEIRYLGLEFGENTHLPHSPTETLNNRYGDCKDKSVLLSRLLARQGIYSAPALVNTSFKNGIRKLLPSPGAFDHVISKFELDGKVYWVDGTRNYQGKSLELRGKTDYGATLLIDKKQRSLISMHNKAPQKFAIKMDEHFQISDYDKPILYTVKTVYFGNEAEYMRYKYANTPPEKISETYLNYYLKKYKDIKVLDDIKITDDKIKNTLTIEESYSLKSALNINSKKYILSLNLSAFSMYLNAPEKQNRTLAYKLYGPATIENNFSVSFPEPPNFSFDGEETNYSTDAFEYSYTDDYLNGIYTHKAKLKIKADRVQPEQFKEFITKREKIADEWGFTISYPKPELNPKDKNIIALKDRLKVLRGMYDE